MLKMDAMKRIRTSHRSAFTKVFNELTEHLSEENKDVDEISILFELLQEKMRDLDNSSTDLLNQILTMESIAESAAIFNAENASTDEYKKKFLTAKLKVTRLLSNVNGAGSNVSINTTTNQQSNIKTFKLPKIEIVKFSGNIRDWLLFWNQFRKIHEDTSIDDEDKFQHLVQSIENGSRAYELVNSFPPTRENYAKAITSLKNRFGKDELQVEVYVRELLSLVLNNVVRGKEKISLVQLYDKLETQMRALETLGVTSDKCAAMLYPLVESSLPEEVLRAWQRTPAASSAKDSKSRLTQLMEFLGSEVENEERIRMAIAGFSLGGTEKAKRYRSKDDSPHEVPTAMELLTTQKTIECMFCKNNNHNSEECYKAKRMALSERREIVKETNSCFNCLKQGHSYKRCKSKIKCAWCYKRHVLLMCPSQGKSVNSGDKGDSKNDIRQEQNLASFTSVPEVYLQTLCVKLVNGNREYTIRVLFDSGSQRSYLTREAIDKLNYRPIKNQELIHTLFGGVKSAPEKHGVYLIHLKNLRGDYACNFQAMDKEMICGNVAPVKSTEWKKELENNGVFLSD